MIQAKKKYPLTSEANLCCVDTVHTNRLERTSSEVVHNRLGQNQYYSQCSQISPGLTSSGRIGCSSLSQRVNVLCWRAIRCFSETVWRVGNPISFWMYWYDWTRSWPPQTKRESCSWGIPRGAGPIHGGVFWVKAGRSIWISFRKTWTPVNEVSKWKTLITLIFHINLTWYWWYPSISC